MATTSRTTEVSSPLGPTIPGLIVRERLGGGAQSTVYRVQRDGHDHALKILREEASSEGREEAARSFRREAAVLACLHHPALPEIHEVGQSDGRPYLIMELLDGRDLAEVLRDGPLPERELVAYAMEIADALTAAHRHGLVHRDVKPANIIIVGDHAKLIDFGLATHAGRSIDDDVVTGTMLYSSPEQNGMLNRPVDARSDLYSLGAVLHQCATGSPPFEASDVGELLRLHAVAPPPDLAAARPDLSPALAAIVARLLAKDPDDRYQQADGLLADLRAVADGSAGDEDWAVGRHDHPANSMQDIRLVGRDTELAQLDERWVGARGGSGAIALVEGSPGGGKSRLVREVAARATADAALVLRGKCLRDNPVPLAPLREALDEHVRSLGRMGDLESAELIGRLRAAAGGDARLLASGLPGLAQVLGVTPDPTDQSRHDQFPVAAAGFLAELATQWGGALLAIDDVQWLDDASRRVVRELDAIVGRSRLLVLATGRNDGASTVGCDRFRVDAGRSLACTIVLRPLDDAAIAELIRVQLGGAILEDHVIEQITVRSDGNPLTAVEYLRAIIEAGLLRPSWGTCHVDRAGLDRLALPDDVVELVIARARVLGEDTRRILAAAAVHGGRFVPELLADAIGVDHRAALDAVSDAVRARLVEPGDDGDYAFLHDRLREALLSDVGPPERRALHQSLAQCMDRDHGRQPVYAIARHYARGDGSTPSRDWEHNVAAGMAALAEYSGTEACEFFEHAATVAPAAGRPPTAAFEAAFARACILNGELSMAAEHFASALAMEDDDWVRARMLADRSRMNQGLSRVDEAYADVEAALAGVGHGLTHRPALLAISLVTSLVRALFGRFLGRGFGRATGEDRERYKTLLLLHDVGGVCSYIRMTTLPMLAHAIRSLHPANRVGPSPEYVKMWSALGLLAAVLKQRHVVRRIDRRNVELAAGFGDPQIVARIALNRGLALDLLGDAVASTDTLTTLLEEQGRWLDTTDFFEAVEFISWNFALRGHFTDAATWLDRSGERIRRSSVRSVEHLDDYLLMEMGVGAALGRATHTAVQQDEAAGRLRANGDIYSLLRSLIGLTVLHTERGDLGPAFDTTIDEFDRAGLSPRRAEQYMRHLWIHKAWGRIEQYRATGDDAHRTAARQAIRQLGQTANIPLLKAHHRLAQASFAQVDGDHRTALRRAVQAERLAVEVDAPLVRFGAVLVRARVLRSQDRPREAGTEARIAAAIASDHGWVPRARAVQSEFALDGTFTTTTNRSSGRTPVRQSTVQATGATGGTGTIGATREQRHLRALLDVSLAASSVLEPRELARVALDEIVRILNAERALLFLCQDGTEDLELMLARDDDGHDMPMSTAYSTTLVERVRSGREALVVTGTEEGAALGSESVVLHGLRSMLLAPIELEGRLLGVVYLDSRLAKGMFTKDDVDILVAITNHVAISLETARAAQLEVAIRSERERRAMAEALRDGLAEVSASLEPDEVLERMLVTAAGAIPHDHACLLLDEADGLRVVAAGVDPPRLPATPTSPELAALANLLAASGPVVVTDRKAGGAPPMHLFPDATSWMAIPLHVREETLGLLLIASTSAVHDQAQAEIASTFASQGLVAFENARLFAEIQRLATTDELTHLNNRRQFLELAEREIAAAKRYGRQLAVLMLDIDYFKQVNDTYGHAVGDTVLREVARRLQAALRVVDVAGRVGGEEFAIALPETGRGARDLAERIRTTIERDPVATSAGDVSVTMSIGLTTLNGADADLGSLLAEADHALYQAKAAGRNRVVAIGDDPATTSAERP
jgi:diguanylate cyclase (GGDEF)-like protein